MCLKGLNGRVCCLKYSSHLTVACSNVKVEYENDLYYSEISSNAEDHTDQQKVANQS